MIDYLLGGLVFFLTVFVILSVISLVAILLAVVRDRWL